MPPMTRAEARGVLQQLAKLWQSRLGEAIQQLHAELLADGELEAEVGALRSERDQLRATHATVQADLRQATDEVQKAQGVLKGLTARHGEAERQLVALREQIAQARRQQERDAASAQRERAMAEGAWQESVSRERAARLAVVERDVTARREVLETGIGELVARKEALERELADLFSRHTVKV